MPAGAALPWSLGASAQNGLLAWPSESRCRDCGTTHGPGVRGSRASGATTAVTYKSSRSGPGGEDLQA